MVDQPFEIGEPWIVKKLTFNERGEYRPYMIVERILGVMKLVDKPELKASAALLVGSLSFGAIWFKKDSLKLVAAGVGMLLPTIYLTCHILKKPLSL